MSEEHVVDGVYEGPVGEPAAPASGKAIASLVCGIIAIMIGMFSCCCWILFGPMAMALGATAFVLGLIARKEALTGEVGGAGLALAGMICGGLGAIFGLGWFILMLILTVMNPGGDFAQQMQNWQVQPR